MPDQIGGRKVEDVIVPPSCGARDAGKIFRITEWSALQAQRWGNEMFLSLKGTGGEIKQDQVRAMGMVGVAVALGNAFLQAPTTYKEIEPVLEKLFECVTIVRDRRHPDVATALLIDTDIEEVWTLYWLQAEVVRVHTGFSIADALSMLGAVSALMADPSSPNMSTSLPQ